MKPLIAIILSLNLTILNLSASIRDIQYENIPEVKSIEPLLDDLFKYEVTYKNWIEKWEFDIPKKDVIRKLKNLHKELESRLKKDSKNMDTILLKGLVEHFLYNLDETEFNKKAISSFENAYKIDQRDIRPHWFLGKHLIKSAKIIEGMNHLISIKKGAPYKDLPANFWEDYAEGASISSMPSNALIALDYAKEILGKPSKLESLVGETWRKVLVSSDEQTRIIRDELWLINSNLDNSIDFTSRTLGIQVSSVPENWQIGGSDYANNGAYINFKLPPELGINKIKVYSNINIIAKVGTKEESFDQFVNKITDRYEEKKPIKFNVPYENYIAFQVNVPDIYKEQGGAIFQYIAFEREQPKHPGTTLEKPIDLNSKPGTNYFRPVNRYTRLSNKIYYFISIDTCKAVSKNSLKMFDEFLRKKMIIE
ncbi:MAG: hypothetical protein SFU98_17990 [Leptospiraceae bacterium]|nr:hypothetical protein [Leptospiraceae bacterium]